MPNDKPLSAGAWKGRIAASRELKRAFMAVWRDNVSMRQGKPFRSKPTDDTVNIPQDWSRTKNKASKLFYQVPEVKLKARRPEYAGATQVFAAALNYQLNHKIRAQYMMNEVLSDVINAAGIGVCKIGYEADFEEVITNQPETQAEGTEMGMQAPEMETAPRAVYECFYARRISPAHFLWPSEWSGSDWNEAPWLGWEGYMPLAEAQAKGWVDENFKGVDIDDKDWRMINDATDHFQKSNDAYVKFCEVFYRPSYYDSQERDKRKIKRVVLVDGLPNNKAIVVDEDFKWQRYVPETGQWIGLTSFPIKVLTLTYISDIAIPPSDSEIGRPQVRELIRGRSQMIRQRESSLPLRWFDVNQVDPDIANNLRKGKWQNMIPMRGPGANAIGEVARGQYPRENFEFDKVAKQDLDEAWSMGAPQQAANQPGDTTATEVNAMQTALNERLDYERSWVLKFFLDVAEGIGNLMQLFSDDMDYAEVVGPDGIASLQPWNKMLIRGDYVFEAKPDSQLRLDVSQKRAEALNMYKLLRKDPLINPQAMVAEVLELHGIDPTKVMVQPQPQAPAPPKFNYSFKTEDLVNPIAVGIIQKSPHALSPEDIEAAKKLIQAAAGMGLPTDPTGNVVEGQVIKPTGENPPHDGPADVVQPLNRRYNEKGETAVEGSRDS